MKDQYASYFEKPEFKQRLAHYEEMLLSGSCFYFEATELTDIAEYYAIQGDSQRAEEVLDYAIRLYPDNIDVLIFKARARLINGYVNEAITIAESITDSNDREVLFLKAELALADSRYRQAEDILRALIETEGYEANTYADIIDLLVDNRQGEMAIKWTDEALASYPSNKALLESAAYNYTQQELYEEAIEEALKAIDELLDEAEGEEGALIEIVTSGVTADLYKLTISDLESEKELFVLDVGEEGIAGSQRIEITFAEEFSILYEIKQDDSEQRKENGRQARRSVFFAR